MIISLIETVNMIYHKFALTDNYHILYGSLKSYHVLFYFSGISPLTPFAKLKKNPSLYKRFHRRIPSVFGILVTLCLFIVGVLFYRECNQRNDIPYLLVSTVYMLVKSFAAITIYSQCFCEGTALKLTIEHIQFLIDYFRCKFQFKISLDEYFRETRCDFIKIILLYLAGFFAYAVTRVNAIKRKDEYLSLSIDALQIPIIIATIHFIFYVNLVKFMMTQLNALVMRQHVCSFCKNTNYGLQHSFRTKFCCCKELCDEIRLTSIKRMKLIYYRLWRATQHLNDFFGWILAAIIIENFVCASFSLYWGSVLLAKKDPLKIIIFPMVVPIVAIVCPAFATFMLLNSAQKLYHEVNISYFYTYSCMFDGLLLSYHFRHFC